MIESRWLSTWRQGQKVPGAQRGTGRAGLRRGRARRGVVWRGLAWPGGAGLGKAWPGFSHLTRRVS